MLKLDREFLRQYQKFKDKIYAYFLFRVNFNRAIAEDLTSEVFLKAYDKFDSFELGRPFQAWIYAIAHNHLGNYYRTANREVELKFADKAIDGCLQALDAGLECEQAFARIEALGDYHRDVLLMRFADGMTNREIAETLGKDEGAVRTQISRALKELRKE